MRQVEHSFSSHHPHPGCVLILVENAQLRKMLTVAFRNAGFRVTKTGSPATAISCLRRHWPEVVIIDLAAHGIDTVRAIRAEAQLDDIAIAYLCTDAHDSVRWRALQAGANCYVLKPFSVLDLQARVAALVQKGRPRLHVIARREPSRLAG